LNKPKTKLDKEVLMLFRKNGHWIVDRRALGHWWLVAILALLIGSQSVPFGPIVNAYSQEAVSSDSDSEDGWLWSRLFGKKTTEPTTDKQSVSSNQTADSAPVANAQAVAASAQGSRVIQDRAVQQTSAVRDLSDIDRPLRASSVPDMDGDSLDGLEELVGSDDDDLLSDTGFDWESLAPENVFKSFQEVIGLGPDVDTAKEAFREGRALYRHKEYHNAAKKFKRAARRWPDSLLEERALFYQAEAHFLADEYSEAHDTIGQLLKKYENSRHLDLAVDRLFRIGCYWEQKSNVEKHWPVTPNFTDSTQPRFDTFGHALKSYEMVALHDPTGPLADDSLMTMANAYFNRNRFEDAAMYYDRIREDYPRSEFQIKAHLLGMKSNEEMYQGAIYDGTPLKEADQVAEQALRQFGRRLGDDYGLVIEARNRFNAKMAERDWSMAQYWEKKGENKAARYYYREVIKQYPSTPVAQAAKQRLTEIADLPDKPANNFRWLTTLFEDEFSEHEGQVIDINTNQNDDSQTAGTWDRMYSYFFGTDE
jgi:outer membrane protein assembly factor BamD (BamD/ComL family)